MFEGLKIIVDLIILLKLCSDAVSGDGLAHLQPPLPLQLHRHHRLPRLHLLATPLHWGFPVGEPRLHGDFPPGGIDQVRD